MKMLSAAAAAAVLFATPAFAEDALAPVSPPVPVSIKMSTAGLDLNRPADVQQLKLRMNAAVTQACTPGGVYQSFQTLDQNCVAEFGAKVDKAVQRIAAAQAARNAAVASR